MTIRSDAGFTLLELLIAMAVLGLLSVLTFSSLSFGTRVWERSQSAAADLNKIRSVQESLRTDLSRLYPKSVGVVGERHVDFDGSGTRLTYLRSKPDLPGAFEQVTLGLVSDTGALTEATVPELSLSQALAKKTLLSGVDGIEIAYFGPPPGGDNTTAPQWWQAWQNRSAPPLLIRIRLTLAGKQDWPELIVAPRVETDVDCIFDALKKTCQGRS